MDISFGEQNLLNDGHLTRFQVESGQTSLLHGMLRSEAVLHSWGRVLASFHLFRTFYALEATPLQFPFFVDFKPSCAADDKFLVELAPPGLESPNERLGSRVVQIKCIRSLSKSIVTCLIPPLSYITCFINRIFYLWEMRSYLSSPRANLRPWPFGELDMRKKATVRTVN